MHLIGYLSSDEENKVTVIEKKKDRCREISNKYDAVILNEDGSKHEIMKKADASEQDLILIATDDDRVNINTARHAKKDFGVPKVIAVANSPKNKERLKEAGADVVICPVDLALRDFENVLSKNASITLMYRTDLDLRVAETTIPMDSAIIGKKLHELKISDKCRITMVTRNDDFLFPDPDVELMSGDRVILMGDAPSVQKTVELLRNAEVV